MILINSNKVIDLLIGKEMENSSISNRIGMTDMPLLIGIQTEVIPFYPVIISLKDLKKEIEIILKRKLSNYASIVTALRSKIEENISTFKKLLKNDLNQAVRYAKNAYMPLINFPKDLNQLGEYTITIKRLIDVLREQVEMKTKEDEELDNFFEKYFIELE